MLAIIILWCAKLQIFQEVLMNFRKVQHLPDAHWLQPNPSGRALALTLACYASCDRAPPEMHPLKMFQILGHRTMQAPFSDIMHHTFGPHPRSSARKRKVCDSLTQAGFYTKGRPLVKSNLISPSDKLSWQPGCPVLNINIQGNFCISQGNGSSDNLPENLV